MFWEDIVTFSDLARSRATRSCHIPNILQSLLNKTHYGLHKNIKQHNYFIIDNKTFLDDQISTWEFLKNHVPKILKYKPIILNSNNISQYDCFTVFLTK